MGGPWRDRRFDATAWRPPTARGDARTEVLESGTRDHLTGIVIGYIASVLTSIAIVLTFLKHGW
jgi:hypothetical protein